MKQKFLLFLLLSSSAFAGERVILKSRQERDNLIAAQRIAAAGMRVQGERLKIVSQNIANEFSTGQDPEDEPYRRKVILFENKFDKKSGDQMVKVKKMDVDKKTPLKVVYEPSHPAANDKGYVAYPNVDRLIEDMDARESQRSYEANLYNIDLAKNMMLKTIDLLR